MREIINIVETNDLERMASYWAADQYDPDHEAGGPASRSLGATSHTGI